MDDRREQEVGVVKDLFQSIDTEKALREKSDDEIADLLLEHVWSGLDPLSPHADLVEAAIERLKTGDIEVVSFEKLPEHPVATMVARFRDPVIRLIRDQMAEIEWQRDELMAVVEDWIEGYDILEGCDCGTCQAGREVKALIDRIRSEREK